MCGKNLPTSNFAAFFSKEGPSEAPSNDLTSHHDIASKGVGFAAQENGNGGPILLSALVKPDAVKSQGVQGRLLQTATRGKSLEKNLLVEL